jgi:hypothetical protein
VASIVKVNGSKENRGIDQVRNSFQILSGDLAPSDGPVVRSVRRRIRVVSTKMPVGMSIRKIHKSQQLSSLSSGSGILSAVRVLGGLADLRVEVSGSISSKNLQIATILVSNITSQITIAVLIISTSN